MVKLAHRPRHLCQSGAVARQRIHAGLTGRLPAGGAEGVDVAHHFVLAPAHFIAEKANKPFVRHRGGSLFPRRPFGADLGAVPGDASASGVIQRVAVVCHGEKVQPLHL